MKKNFIAELRWRKQIHSATHEQELEKLLLESTQPVKAYIGYDPTAPSLTIGNLVTINLLRRFQLAGHQPVVVMGGATGRVGDPSGKDAERTLLDLDTLEINRLHQLEQFKKFLDFEAGKQQTVVRDNWDIYKQMNVMDFLRGVGKYITVNYMMAKDSVKNRIGTEKGESEGMSFTEFSYQLIQGFDFQYLFEQDDCVLQMGGADQWGNIMTGLELIRKSNKSETKRAFGLVCPLLTKSDGKKFGKSESGNLWLDPKLTSPFKFYQYWLGSEIGDADVPKLLRTFSFKDELDEQALLDIEQDIATNTETAIGYRKILAEELTQLIHGIGDLTEAQKASEVVFNAKFSKAYLQTIPLAVWAVVGEEVGQYELEAARLDNGINIIELLAKDTNLCPSKSDAQRQIKGNAIAINGEKTTSPEHLVTKADLIHNQFIMIQNGKKEKRVLKF